MVARMKKKKKTSFYSMSMFCIHQPLTYIYLYQALTYAPLAVLLLLLPVQVFREPSHSLLYVLSKEV